MHVLWVKQEATVADVVEAVSKTSKSEAPAYSTVLTMLRILENKGYVRHRKHGRAFVYQPVVHRGKATDTAVTHLLRRFFENSAELLVLNLLDGKKMSPDAIRRLRKRIEEKK